MKDKLMEYLQKAYSMSPFICGVAVGYMGHFLLKFVMNMSLNLLKLLLG